MCCDRLVATRSQVTAYIPALHLLATMGLASTRVYMGDRQKDVPCVTDVAQRLGPCYLLMRLQDNVHEELLQHGGEYPVALRMMHNLSRKASSGRLSLTLTNSFRASSLSFLGAMEVSSEAACVAPSES